MVTQPLIRIPVAPGELIDKITILQIKAGRVGDETKLKNIQFELEALLKQKAAHLPSSDSILGRLEARLKAVNELIWDLEDAIRDCERSNDFGDHFLNTARSIYHTNDKRAELKKEINLHLGSLLVEEKSYSPY
jgi:hypothetical protein